MTSPLPYKFICLVWLLQPATWLMADTIVLKSGERLEAKITKTTDNTVEAEVKMSTSITDVRVIQKTDIASIEKPDPAVAEFAALKAAGPGPNSLTPADYDMAIHIKFNAFIGKYPASPLVAEAREMMAALEKEKERVALGEVKVENIWYTPAELEKQKDQVNATLLFQQMKSLGQSGDSLGALNVFTKLEKTYPGTRAYPSAVEYAQQLIPNVQTEINTKKSVYANEMTERKKGMDLLPDFKKAPLNAAAASEEAKANAALDAAIKSGTKWTSIYPRNKKSIDELQKTVTAETTRLAAIKTAPMLASIASVGEAKKQMAAGDMPGATASLQKATSLWSANLLLKNANADLTLAKATPIPTPTPSPTPKGPVKSAMKTPLPRTP